jgi:hypothetical protein
MTSILASNNHQWVRLKLHVLAESSLHISQKYSQGHEVAVQASRNRLTSLSDGMLSPAQTDKTDATMVQTSPFKSMVLVMRGLGNGGIG